MIPAVKQRTLGAVALTLPIALVEMARHVIGWPAMEHAQLTIWHVVSAFCTTLVVFVCGWPLLVKGAASFRRRLNMFSLIAPGILITYFYSMVALMSPELLMASFTNHGDVPVYFEAAAMITSLVLLGQLIESKAERRTGDALESLSRLHPVEASVIRDGKESRIKADQVAVGDRLRVRAGERVPVDGVVVDGEALVDESMLTGESLPVLMATGSRATGGTFVKEGALQMTAEKVGSDTVLAHIIEMVKTAQESRAPIQRLADVVTGRLVPGVFAMSALTFVVWFAVGPSPSWWYGLLHAVTVLMITCPCALGLATPMSIMTGLGRGALEGILIKDAAILERLSQVTTIVLDKTGTLTTGRPELHACLPDRPGNETTLLKHAASVEFFSRHPIAEAIVAGARNWGISLANVHQFRSDTGGGVSGTVDTTEVSAGNRAWLEARGVTGFETMAAIAGQYDDEGGTVIWVAFNGTVAGLLVVTDQLKPEAPAAIQALRKRNIRLVMMTGDSSRQAGMIARKLGIEDVSAGVMPAEKADRVRSLKNSGAVIAMAGDGINDAPALASADVGIAVGTGTAVATASGQVSLMKGDLLSLVRAIDLSHAVMRNIRQNLFFAFAYNIIMIPVAAGALYPWTGIMLTPMLASAAMSASSISVIMNALRLRNLKFT